MVLSGAGVLAIMIGNLLMSVGSNKHNQAQYTGGIASISLGLTMLAAAAQFWFLVSVFGLPTIVLGLASWSAAREDPKTTNL